MTRQKFKVPEDRPAWKKHRLSLCSEMERVFVTFSRNEKQVKTFVKLKTI